ncbi:DUF3050 domain-containing protein [Parapedobacter sp. DT-150]|uniref:DUF3050 domain-containing protein n=1 Tax=Parapedobacter sp. DT-150 TaxID=3396162 RepID=UPI003F1BFBC1
MQNVEAINQYIDAERNKLVSHALYSRIKTIADLQRFTAYHVYAVWDFMSLLKALQIKLTCTTIPWFATPSPNTRYLINEIVLAEESDEYVDGRRLSHYEMYLDAMRTLGADTKPIEGLVDTIRSGKTITEAIDGLEVDHRIKAFLQFSFDIIEEGEPHKIASAFTFGRENLIPDMFTSILHEFQQHFPHADLTKLIYYFKRHIELDSDEHGPLAMMMIQELGGEDGQKWKEMGDVAKVALTKRLALWDAILDAVDNLT